MTVAAEEVGGQWACPGSHRITYYRTEVKKFLEMTLCLQIMIILQLSLFLGHEYLKQATMIGASSTDEDGISTSYQVNCSWKAQ